MREATKEERGSIDNYIKSISHKIDDEVDIPIKHESKPYLMIPLPDNATNGDVIKTMFPNAVIEAVYEPFYNVDVIKVDFYGYGKYFTTFDRDWWSAPYKRGEQE